MELLASGCLNTISLFPYSPLWHKNWWMELHEILHFDASYLKLLLFRVWWISIKRLRCCSKLLISLIELHRRKLHEIVPNVDYFTPIILKFKTFINNGNKKIIYNFCTLGAMFPSVVRHLWRGNYSTLVFLKRMPLNTQN